MQYSFMTQDEQDDIVVRAMKQREVEHFHYTHNIDVYTTMLTSLPIGAWPTELEKYKGLNRDQIVAAAGENATTVLNYQYRDQLEHLIKTEAAEAGRVELIYDGLVARFVGDTERVERAKTRVQAAPQE